MSDGTMLTQFCTREFRAKDRVRGENRSLQRQIELQAVGQQGAMAIVEGSRGESYITAVDFSSLEEGELGVWCDCPWFQKGNNCKHLWGMLRKVEQTYQIPLQDPTRLELYETDASTMDVGEKLPPNKVDRSFGKGASVGQNSRSHSSQSSVTSTAPANGQRQRPSKTIRQRGVSDWKNVLETITQATQLGSNGQDSAIPAQVFQDARCQQQHWFVLSLAEVDNQRSLRVNILASTRKADGDWGKPVPCYVSPSRLGDAVDERERSVFALLRPIGTSVVSRGYFRSEEHSVFQIDPSVLDESMEALHATGRFAWKLSDSRYFEDAAAIQQVDTGEPWRLAVTIAPSQAKETQLSVAAILRRGDEEHSLASVMLASDLGCALVHLNRSDAKSPDPDEAAEGPKAATAPPIETDAEGVEPTIDAGVIKIDSNAAAAIRVWQQAGQITVPRRSINTLIDQLATSHENHDLIIDADVDVERLIGEPTPRCLLHQARGYAGDFEAQLFARYQDEEIPFDSPRKWWWNRSEKQLVFRNPEVEAKWLEAIPAAGFRVVEREGATRLQIPTDRFLHVVETLRTAGWDVLAEGTSLRVATDFNISVTSGVDWFDVYADVEFDDVAASLPQLLAALRSGNKTVLLDDGTQGMLPEAWLKRFAGLEASGEEVDDAIRFGRTQALLLDAMLAEQDDVQSDKSFADFCKKLKSFEGIAPADAPETFTGKLREYQRLGLGWFEFLQEFRFGGCLADDMGLGKTIQVLAMLEHRRLQVSGKGRRGKQEQKPSIAVVPKSLIFNWIDEAKRFTPKLNVFNYTGTDRRGRFEQASADTESPIDLILTTYGTLRNDAASLREIEFDYAILDEAQAIKNPKSLAAKASRLLRADHRLAMTGTPVENHLGDLWSLFDFLNPGMLGSAPKVAKLSDEEDQKRIQHVSQSLRPFILRRKKEHVLTELPEKTEQTLSCEMSTAQRKLYNQLRDHYRLHISKKVEELGLKRSKIHVLEALLRLRQAACDPRLVNPDSNVTGTKIASLMQQLEGIISEGHKALVFSQFTSLLSLVRQEIDQREWQYEYLDGKTNKRNQHVKRFQEDEDCRLFLISLKAGGNGLNLTAADYVFILDPWWNPAVEAQAIDRAHRIGQTKSVMAYRMICSETVEDKIIELQQSKRELADAIISQDNSLISELTADDLQQLLS